jgi:4a-hydroxytetrahydrobiopterin dehydratase
MSALTKMKCEACRAGAPAVTDAQIGEYTSLVPDWRIVTRDNIRRLERVYPFPDFAGALAFTAAVGALAEAEGHHPAILTEWGRVTVTWWTHKVNGLHLNDFVMAAKTDAIPGPGTRRTA